MFSFKDGQLANRASIARNGGYGFGPRHLDFHPTLPVVYVSRERENKLDVYRLTNGTLDPQPIFVKDTLAEPGNIRSRQAASTVHVHPNGRHVYVSNRAFDTVDFEGKKIFPGGENNIAVFAIDSATGEPALIQNEDVRGIYPRTFALDPSARMLVVANIQPMLIRDGAGLKTVPANLATYHVGPDGKLTFARSYDVDTGNASQFGAGWWHWDSHGVFERSMPLDLIRGWVPVRVEKVVKTGTKMPPQPADGKDSTGTPGTRDGSLLFDLIRRHPDKVVMDMICNQR